MNTSTMIALSSLAVSVIGTLAIPYMNSLYKKYKLKVEFEKFEELIHTEYIEKMNRSIDTYSDRTSNDFRIFLKEVQVRLKKLKQEEILYINSENQFKMIRLIELVKQYFEIMSKVEYFREQTIEGMIEQHNKHIEWKKKEFKKIQNIYNEVKTDYLELRKDNLILNLNDYLSLRHSEFHEISDMIESKRKNGL
ncbi:hypothetical protein [Marinilactibacillus psychrotolerans]|uniref:hypothetical protein n=1 Tax=Marinilactibacillus psychrotolerans TaxID=191770 RepID=UPI0018685EB4|nr:hypothetical protein [Marinilactibacillus psychrotolerans]